uniref:FERM and PDZ domain-containing protein 4 n=1 Tax=Panagrolaimus sp. ES5 TaxID=591445 RepID=A0AC34GPV7_9BILA
MSLNNAVDAILNDNGQEEEDNDDNVDENDDGDDYHTFEGKHVPSECDLCVLAEGRIFYIYHKTKQSYWEPPRVSWNCYLQLPYGWEEAVDAFGAQYFINHITKNTTYEDPRQGSSSLMTTRSNETDIVSTSSPDIPDIVPQRTYEIHRHPTIGFGFVAASQHPVIIQFVTLGGPSDGKLLANDQIIEVNGLDVKEKGKDEVVAMIRGSNSPIKITVAQLPPKKKNTKRRNCRVRFEDRIFVSNGDSDVLNSLVEKLQIKNGDRFTLASEQSICTRSPKLSLLAPDQLLSKIASLPSSQSSRARFRLTFVPVDLREFATDDPFAFNYLYEQCVNDVVAGRFSYEMRYEACVRLAALHLRQIAIDTNSLKPNGRASVSRMEKEYGLATFLPTILLENVKRKEIRKHLRFYLKKDDDEEPQARCQSSISPRDCTPIKKCSLSEDLPSFSVCSYIEDITDISLSLKLKYVQIVSHLPTFSGRCFSVTFKQTHVDMIIQTDPLQGLLVRQPGKLSQPNISIDYNIIESLIVSSDIDIFRAVTVKLKSSSQQGLDFFIDKDDLNDFILYVLGYCKVIYKKTIPVEYSNEPIEDIQSAPPYRGTHYVYPAGWNYSSEVKSGVEIMANFLYEPPSYHDTIGATSHGSTDHCSVETGVSHLGGKVPIREKNGSIHSNKKSEAISETSKFIDDSSPSDNSIEPRSIRGSPSIRRTKFLQVTDSLLVKNRSSLSPRFRDSIRIYKQRHSVPNGALLPRSTRRLSSSSDTDCSQSPKINYNDILAKFSTPTSPQNSQNPPKRFLFIQRNSLVPPSDNKTVSFGLNSPDQLPQLNEKNLDSLLNPKSFGVIFLYLCLFF